ncbi:MAG: hypothetical protein NTX35_06815 [Verrucomicrobia bacterium]|nr:hypothetical protein [Verrucomicrobiota bacterium]
MPLISTLLLFGMMVGPQAVEPPQLMPNGKFVEAPQQDAPWSCPIEVPDKLEKAASLLFSLGYADPRGLEYKSVTIQPDQVRSIDVHGWVFSGDNGCRYVVAWNGMIYGAESEGVLADLETDVKALIERDDRALAHEKAEREKDAAAWEKAEKRPYPFTHRSWSRVRAPFHSFSHERLWFHQPLMLLRLGRTELAVNLWKRWFDAADKDAEANATDDLVREWLGAWKDRASYAHSHHDDSLALKSLQFIEVTLQSTGTPRFRGVVRLPFGHEELLADQERRLREHVSQLLRPGDWESTQKWPVDRQVSEWIRWLDDADEKLSSQIERRVLAAGQAALEPLLTHFLADRRLTRHTQTFFSRPPQHTIAFVPVWEELNSLASQLAGLPHGVLDAKRWALVNSKVKDEDMRNTLADFIRQEAGLNKGLSLDAVAWRHLNQDDDPHLWGPAASTLCRELNSFYGDDPEPQTQLTRVELESLKAKRAPLPVLLGEKYRNKSNPSVSELMLSRAKQLEERQLRQEAEGLRQANARWEAAMK